MSPVTLSSGLRAWRLRPLALKTLSSSAGAATSSFWASASARLRSAARSSSSAAASAGRPSLSAAISSLSAAISSAWRFSISPITRSMARIRCSSCSAVVPAAVAAWAGKRAPAPRRATSAAEERTGPTPRRETENCVSACRSDAVRTMRPPFSNRWWTLRLEAGIQALPPVDAPASKGRRGSGGRVPGRQFMHARRRRRTGPPVSRGPGGSDNQQ